MPLQQPLVNPVRYRRRRDLTDARHALRTPIPFRSRTHRTPNTAKTGDLQEALSGRINRLRWLVRNIVRFKYLAASVYPAVGGVQDRQHRTPLSALPDLASPSQQLRLAAAQPVHRHEHELAVKRLDDLGSFERDGIVREQLVET